MLAYMYQLNFLGLNRLRTPCLWLFLFFVGLGFGLRTLHLQILYFLSRTFGPFYSSYFGYGVF
jgi:hypothetical protein